MDQYVKNVYVCCMRGAWCAMCGVACAESEGHVQDPSFSAARRVNILGSAGIEVGRNVTIDRRQRGEFPCASRVFCSGNKRVFCEVDPESELYGGPTKKRGILESEGHVQDPSFSAGRRVNIPWFAGIEVGENVTIDRRQRGEFPCASRVFCSGNKRFFCEVDPESELWRPY
jgi:hypothetical protein